MEIILCLSYHISLFQILLAVSNKIVRLDCPSLLIGFIIIANRKQSLRNHVESKHLKILRYACSSCDYKSYFDHNVKKHQHVNHKGQQVKVIARNCTFCQENVEHEKHFNPDAPLWHI